jgi:hypothetical protein
MPSIVDRHVIARESNVVRVDFSRDSDPPAPRFPDANGLRVSDTGRDRADCAGARLDRRGVDRFQNITGLRKESSCSSVRYTIVFSSVVLRPRRNPPAFIAHNMPLERCA